MAADQIFVLLLVAGFFGWIAVLAVQSRRAQRQVTPNTAPDAEAPQPAEEDAATAPPSKRRNRR